MAHRRRLLGVRGLDLGFLGRSPLGGGHHPLGSLERDLLVRDILVRHLLVGDVVVRDVVVRDVVVCCQLVVVQMVMISSIRGRVFVMGPEP